MTYNVLVTKEAQNDLKKLLQSEQQAYKKDTSFSTVYNLNDLYLPQGCFSAAFFRHNYSI